MERVAFHEGDLPAGIKPAYKLFLFQTAAHRLGQAPDQWASFFLLKANKPVALGEVHFHLSGLQAATPYRAPFGSFQFADDVLPEEIFDFITWVEQRLRLRGVRKVSIKNPPGAYGEYWMPAVEVMLQNQGFRVSNAEISASLTVDKISFGDKIHAWEQRKRKQAKKEHLKFEKQAFSELETYYRFIEKCRMDKQQAMTMSWEELQRTATENRKSFFLFGVYDQRTLVAASIAIDVGHHVLYTFYYAHAPEYDRLSPVVLLLDGIYEWANENKFVTIDLGTSAIHGQPNFPLLQFKLNVGAQLSAKLTFEKALP